MYRTKRLSNKCQIRLEHPEYYIYLFINGHKSKFINKFYNYIINDNKINNQTNTNRRTKKLTLK